MRYIYFRKDLAEFKGPDNDTMAKVNRKYELETFKPDWFHIAPKGMKKSFALIIWWFLYLIVWGQRAKSYEHYLVYDGERLIHYCIVLPKNYRYPFMGNDDVQIGPFRTAEEYRGQGICPIMICKIMNKYKFQKKYAFIITRENNIKSQRSIAKAGLNIYGYGIRTKGFLGKFLIETVVQR